MAAIVAIIGGLVAGGTAYYNSEQGKKAAEKAAAAEQEAARNAGTQSAAAQAQARADSAPYSSVGQNALYTLADLMGQKVNEAAPVTPTYMSAEEIAAGKAKLGNYAQDIRAWGDLANARKGAGGQGAGDFFKTLNRNTTDEGTGGGLFKTLAGGGDKGNTDWQYAQSIVDKSIQERDALQARLDRAANYEADKKAYDAWQARQNQGPSAQFGSLTKPFTMQDFYANQDPSYGFRMAENIKGLDRSAAARGDLFSGAQGKALGRFTQDYASNEYANAYNRYTQNQADIYNKYANLAGMGQTSVQQVNSLGSNAAANQGNYLLQGGNAAGQGYLNAQQARASGYTGMANALNTGLTNYLTYKEGQDKKNKQNNSQTTGYTTVY